MLRWGIGCSRCRIGCGCCVSAIWTCARWCYVCWCVQYLSSTKAGRGGWGGRARARAAAGRSGVPWAEAAVARRHDAPCDDTRGAHRASAGARSEAECEPSASAERGARSAVIDALRRRRKSVPHAPGHRGRRAVVVRRYPWSELLRRVLPSLSCSGLLRRPERPRTQRCASLVRARGAGASALRGRAAIVGGDHGAGVDPALAACESRARQHATAAGRDAGGWADEGPPGDSGWWGA